MTQWGFVSAERDVSQQLRRATELVPGTRYYLECRWVDDGQISFADIWLYQPGEPAPGPSAEALARQAYEQVPLVVPTPHTSPPADAEQLVGFPTWLWIEPDAWRTFTAEAAVPGLSVSVTATPRHVTWTTGDGGTVTCAGPGTPWISGGGANQSSDCSHTYQFVSAHEADGLYHPTVTVTWSVTWQASTGESGTLADASRTAGFSLDVGERQAVVTYRG